MAECLSKNTSLEDQRLQASRLHCGSGAVAQAAWDDPFAGAGTSLWRSFSSNEWADSAQTRAGATTEEALSQAVPRRTRRGSWCCCSGTRRGSGSEGSRVEACRNGEECVNARERELRSCSLRQNIDRAEAVLLASCRGSHERIGSFGIALLGHGRCESGLCDNHFCPV